MARIIGFALPLSPPISAPAWRRSIDRLPLFAAMLIPSAAGFQTAARRRIKAWESVLLAPFPVHKAALRADLQQKHPRSTGNRSGAAISPQKRFRASGLHHHLASAESGPPAAFLRRPSVFRPLQTGRLRIGSRRQRTGGGASVQQP